MKEEIEDEIPWDCFFIEPDNSVEKQQENS